MKIVFIIPFRAPESCDNWQVTSMACTGTLQSIANQTSSNYKCVMVCNEPPEIVPNVNNLEILQVNFPIPKNIPEFIADKGKRTLYALAHLQESGADSEYAMKVDADDRLHKNLVSFLEENNSVSGWRVGKGIVYTGGKWIRQHNGNFDKLCGTSNICRADNLNHDGPLMISHCDIEQHFVDIGAPLKDLPFYSAVKVVNYGGNITATKFVKSESVRRTIRKLSMIRPVSAKFISDFAFDSNPFVK